MGSLVDIGPISTGAGQCVLFALKAGNLPMQTISFFRELIDIALNSRTLHFRSASLDVKPAIYIPYFETAELPIRLGRGISGQDGPESPRVVVLSESVARHYWSDYPHGDPIGRHIKLGNSQSPWLTVAGVSGDVKDWFTGQPMPAAYIPSVQAPQRAMMLLLRTAGDPLGVATSARAAVRAVDRNPPVYDVKSMEQIIAWQTSGVGAAAMSMEIY